MAHKYAAMVYGNISENAVSITRATWCHMVSMDTGSKDRAQYCCDSEVMGHHIYKDVWEAIYGEILSCYRETGNAFDAFTICVKKDAEVVGHIPRKILLICSMFM